MNYFSFSKKAGFLLWLSAWPFLGFGQVLTLKDAVQTALTNYSSIRAKTAYAAASKVGIEQSRRDYLPNLSLAAQQDYGTINGQNGPLYGFGGLGVASSGAALEDQNWHAAFGALYLTNLNWDFFAFGRAKEKIKVATAVYSRDTSDLAQERFQQAVRAAGAYLNLLAAQRLLISQQKNLERATIFKNMAVVRALNGLLPGVDSSLANAEVSSARIALTNAQDFEQDQANRLAVTIGITPTAFVVDTNFIQKIPGAILTTPGSLASTHPLLRYYRSRAELSDQQARYYQRLAYPTVSLFSVFQTRGSGFEPAYILDQGAYSRSYLTGINPVRSNYLIGVGASWNLTSILRVRKQVEAQQFVSQGLSEEYNLVEQQVKAQLLLADSKIKNALANYTEAPIQLKSAQDAYLQKTTLYRNGLTTLVDVTQALYTLNRAETDRDIAYANVWQALLLKAAASGDLNLFLNEF